MKTLKIIRAYWRYPQQYGEPRPRLRVLAYGFWHIWPFADWAHALSRSGKIERKYRRKFERQRARETQK